MYAVCVTFQIKAGMFEEFMSLMQQQAQNSLKLEEACHRFDICTDADKLDEVFLYEIYEDAEAFKVHLASDHFKAFDVAIQALLVGKEVKTYSTVYP
jgi:quinol monooxygenase YgiN